MTGTCSLSGRALQKHRERRTECWHQLCAVCVFSRCGNDVHEVLAGGSRGGNEPSAEEAAGGSRGTLIAIGTYGGEVSRLIRLQDSFKEAVLLQIGRFKTKMQECAKNTVYGSVRKVYSCRSRCRTGLGG